MIRKCIERANKECGMSNLTDGMRALLSSVDLETAVFCADTGGGEPVYHMWLYEK
jgi:hypothetical protein